MIIGTRAKKPGKRLVSVTLYRRPTSPLEGAEMGRMISGVVHGATVRKPEDGPLGGTPLLISDEKVGEVVSVPVLSGPWPVSRIHDHALAQVAYQLEWGMYGCQD